MNKTLSKKGGRLQKGYITRKIVKAVIIAKNYGTKYRKIYVESECYAILLCSVVYFTETKFSEWLWHETRKSRMESLNSSFVQGIKDGTLHPTYFGK